MKEEKSFIDTTIITVSGIMLAGSIVLVGQSRINSDFVRYFLAISLISICLSFLLTIWHKWRFPIREKLFESKINQYKKQVAKEITELYQSTITPFLWENVSAKLMKEGINDPNQIQSRIEHYVREIVDTQTPLFQKLAESYAPGFSDRHKQAYESPLDEKLSRIKYLIDYSAFKSRYTFFVIGFLLFVASLVSQLFQ